jgi:hypothetical protein
MPERPDIVSQRRCSSTSEKVKLKEIGKRVDCQIVQSIAYQEVRDEV